jgi:ArsR family transcriptional regulator
MAVKKCARNKIEAEIFERQARICKAFANSTRLRILDLLGKHDWRAARLQEELGISKANLSQHIAILKAAGIVGARREGRQIYFTLVMPEAKRACHLIHEVLRAQVRNGRQLNI